MSSSNRVSFEHVAIGNLELLVIDIEHSDPAIPALTASELDVARLAVEGCSNEEIAEARGTSAKTIANQLRSIYEKVGVTSRFELAAKLFA